MSSHQRETPLGSQLQLSVVIPAFNEAATIEAVVDDHRIVARRLARDFEIVVCDDASTDVTWELLAARTDVHEMRLLRNSKNLGAARTLKRLLDDATGEWIYFAPGDGQVPAEALELMWPLRDGAAVVVGWRRPRCDPRLRVAIALVYSSVLRAGFGLPVHDIDSVKLYDAAALRRLPPTSESDFFAAEVLIGFHRSGRVLREIRIGHRPRVAGKARGVTPLSAYLALRSLARFVVADWQRRFVR